MSFRAPGVWREESAPLLSMITYFVYIISNKSRRLYVGISGNLPLRMLQHKYKVFPDSFTARYNFDILVYFERFYDPYRAIARETEIKKWRREKKLKLIATMNPDWADLSAEWREDEGWRALPDAEYRPRLRPRPRKP
jgi:putative endonuclease